ncbi:winged helix-turn-helix domain-containing protein [Bdellovibrio sp. HCB209]|uniref:winged helix-turn-helix domain-containing protein n=1 Tax=Bdellovibrio sp. HCB209 TaxID=3394354 RepID=UPI0039B42022
MPKNSLSNSGQIQHPQGFYQLGKFQDAIESALAICASTSLAENSSLWIQSARIAFQSHNELLTTQEVTFLRKELLEKLDLVPEEIVPEAFHLLGLWETVDGTLPKAQNYFEQALVTATKHQNFEYVARSLHALSFAGVIGGKPQKAMSLADKALIILDQLQLEDLRISCLFLKSHVYVALKEYDKASELLWLCYEKAMKGDLHYLSLNILTQLAVIHKHSGKNSSAEIYITLVVRGLDQKKHPRLYHIVNQKFSQEESNAFESDLIIDPEFFNVKARDKGSVNFKNQHILFDLLTAFAANPGQRYTKEDLIEKIWNLPYDPSVHDNLVYVSIKRLRVLLEPTPDSPRYILRDRAGYYIPQSISIKMS